jgi:hypothetical protein
MPLLNIGGITTIFNSLNAAFVFLSKECEEDYVWAAEEISMVIGVFTEVVCCKSMEYYRTRESNTQTTTSARRNY